jgi:hypothetical protein
MSRISPADGCGYVYFLLNEAMPGLLKIGYTTAALDERLSHLHTTGVPKPFTLGAAFHVADAKKCEAELHRLLADRRESDKREFFRVSVAEALVTCLESLRKYLDEELTASAPESTAPIPPVDKDDISFMQFILHDGSDTGKGVSTKELAGHHVGYHSLEVERKLLRLADLGLIKKLGRGGQVESRWWMTPEGIKFMFDGGHTLQGIFEDFRQSPKDSR